ncbi:hypothetical protein OROMI_003858 [Orobanche minor]
MSFFRKAVSILGRSVSSHISHDISFSKPTIFQAVRWMSSPKLFVGGLSLSTDDRSLEEAFNKYGVVVDDNLSQPCHGSEPYLEDSLFSRTSGYSLAGSQSPVFHVPE